MQEDLTIEQNRNEILSGINKAAKRAGRAIEAINLVAVSKMQTDERVAAILAAGQRVFGENRVQEAQRRWGQTFAAQRGGLELRFIGPLQSNKAADACALFDVIETLDREKLAIRLAQLRDKGIILPRFFVQINTGEEPQKSGLAPRELPTFMSRLRAVYDLHPEGLMCIPPAGEAASPHFWLLRNLAQDQGLGKLSMGMSADYEVAVEIGATHIRIGSALFGARELK